ncbi:MAG: ROK family transcriptional regulator [Firmicutes bacterium]|nr:ROK family transcriptional regulator [Bacillota bacterium]
MLRGEKPASKSRDLKVLNRLLVRETIRRQGPIARHEVAKLTGLTPPTVTVIVNELLAEGVVREIGFGESTGGRRPVMLALNPRAGDVFAVRIQRGQAVTALLDLGAEVLASQVLRLESHLPGEVVEAVVGSCGQLLEATGIRLGDVFWCGVASPGLVDSSCGLVARSSNLDWENVPLGKMLSERLGEIPVHVENISNAAAVGERLFGSGRGCPNLIYLNLSVGIGAGIVINGEIFGGARGYAGEVGHMVLVPEGGPRCACGREGCFEALCGARTVLEKAKEVLDEEVLKRYGLKKDDLTIAEVVSRPLVELPEIQEILAEVGAMVGIALANLVSLFNPEMVVLGGELARAGSVLLEPATRVAKERALGEIVNPVRFVLSGMSQDPPLMGAYALALEKIFQVDDWRTRPLRTASFARG